MIHNTPISFVKALVTKFLSLNSNEEVSKIQIVRKRYIGSKQNILSTGKSNIALHIKKKGTFEFNFGPVMLLATGKFSFTKYHAEAK